MSDNKYNGWTNYATWRIQLEVVSDYVDTTAYEDDEIASEWLHMDTGELADVLEQYVDEVVFQDGSFNKEMSLAESYASAFLSDVNYYELAEHAQQVAQEALKEQEAEV